jgi:hypothetical protein
MAPGSAYTNATGITTSRARATSSAAQYDLAVVAFARHSSDPVRWLGDPSCQDGHDAILDWLRQNYPLFLADRSQFTTRIQGNLGKCMA